MTQERSTFTLDDLRTMIRDSGLRCTGSRVTVLQRLIAATAPLTHAELAEALVPLGFDQATVYRNLTDLTEAGLLARLDLGDHVWRFEFRGEELHNDGEHPHFVCTDCGKVSCLPDVNIKITHTASVKSFMGEICEIFLKGRCEQCA
ncbi:MAG: transcriptional repressor [Bradymonadaceae bacterium]|nr:transcriptional repressor [Lujinxingiaceae bacterium]